MTLITATMTKVMMTTNDKDVDYHNDRIVYNDDDNDEEYDDYDKDDDHHNDSIVHKDDGADDDDGDGDDEEYDYDDDDKDGGDDDGDDGNGDNSEKDDDDDDDDDDDVMILRPQTVWSKPYSCWQSAVWSCFLCQSGWLSTSLLDLAGTVTLRMPSG